MRVKNAVDFSVGKSHFPEEKSLPYRFSARNCKAIQENLLWGNSKGEPAPPYNINTSAVYKPSSVFDDHLSRPQVAMGLKRLPEGVTGSHMRLPFNLAPDGVYRADESPGRW